MTIRRLIALLAPVVALLALAVPASAAPDLSTFQVQMTPPGDLGGTQPDCTPGLMEIGAALLLGGGPVDVTCSLSATASGRSATGTVANPTLAASTGDAGFADGTIAATCDSAQALDLALSIGGSLGAFAPDLKTLHGTMFQMCAFHMAFADADASTLDGTIELNGTADMGDGSESGSNVVLTLHASVFVTDGSGAFEGQTGSGTFDQSQTVPFGAGGGGSGGGGSGGSGGGGSGGGSGGSGVTAEEQAVCDLVHLTPCIPDTVTAICGNHPVIDSIPGGSAACTAAGRRLVLGPRTRFAVRTGGDKPMRLTLRKAAGAARILLPAPKKGQLAKVTAATASLRLVATKGAVCTLRASDNGVVGRGTSKSGGKSVKVKVAKGSLRGVRNVKAYCTLGGRKFQSQAVKVAQG